MEVEKELKPIDPETICRQCARCCHLKELVKGKTVFLKETCPNLIETPHKKAKCRIYDHRLRDPIGLENGKFIRCLTPEMSFRQSLLPPDCPYVYYFQHGADKKLRAFVAFQTGCDTQDWDGFNPKPEKNCKHCYGRGYTAQNALTKAYVPCVCLSK